MNWKTIIKEDIISKKKRDRRERAASIADKRSTPIKLVGDVEEWDNPDYEPNADINDMEEDKVTEADLVEMTRQDLIETAIDWIESLPEKDLMDLLVSSLGQINISNISYEDKNRKD